MTQDEIIKMAIEAEFVSHGKPSDEESELFVCVDKDIYRFAKLVAAKAVAELESQELTEQNVCPKCRSFFCDHTCKAPQRTWVGLTDESRKQLINKCWNEYIAGKEDASSFSEWISVAIEAELKEKNT